jgi:hypothetical protein
VRRLKSNKGEGTLSRALPRAPRAAATAVALACSLIAMATPARAHWEPARPIDNAGGGFQPSGFSAIAVGPNGLASALFLQPPTSGSPFNAYAVRRPAGAASWSAPAQVSTPAALAQFPDLPHLAVRADGGSLGTLQTSNRTLLTAWPASQASPGAATEALCTPPPTPTCANQGPQVALDAAGNAVAVASTARGGNSQVLFADADAATGAAQPAEVIAQGYLPDVAADPAGDVVVTYFRLDRSNPVNQVPRLYARRRLAGEASFGEERLLSADDRVTDLDLKPLVMDGDGNAITAYLGSVAGADTTVKIVTWFLSDTTPDPPRRISDPSEGQAAHPALAVDPAGRPTLTWQAFGAGFAVYAADRPGISWSAPQRLSANDRTAVSPDVAADGDGTATVVYVDAAPPDNSDADTKASRHPLGGSWSAPVSLRSTAPGSGAVSTGGNLAPRVAARRAGQADVTFTQQVDGVSRLLATRWDHGGYPHPKGATPLFAPLVIAYKECTSPNSQHGAPLSYGSCVPPSQASDQLTVGSPDANGQAANSIGSVRYAVVPGDVQINFSMTDVRKKSDLSDYTGELQVNQSLRITDRDNGPDPTDPDPGTTEDIGFPVTAQCTATASTTIGSTCAVSTTADSVVPGSVTAGKRAIWQLGQVRVFDGGSDGDVGTAPNTLFATQGVFVP